MEINFSSEYSAAQFKIPRGAISFVSFGMHAILWARQKASKLLRLTNFRGSNHLLPAICSPYGYWSSNYYLQGTLFLTRNLSTTSSSSDNF